jgi:hypothetical protein
MARALFQTMLERTSDDRDFEGIAHPDWSNYDLQGIDEAHGITYYGEVRLESHLECRLPKREPIEVSR